MAHRSGSRLLLPTAGGILLLLAALLLLLTAINYANNLIFALAFFVLAVWGQGAWEAWHNLAGVEAGDTRAAPVHAGEVVSLQAWVDNPRRMVAQDLSLVWQTHAGDAGDVAAQGHARLHLALPGMERGEHRLSGLRLVATDSLGLWRASLPAGESTALVYPRAEGNAALPETGAGPAHRRTGGDALEGIRPYQPGDPLARVNWKAAAKREDLVVNRFDGGQGSVAVWLDLDVEAGGLETRLSRLAGQVLAAERAGREWGLRLGALRLGPDTGEAHRHACLAALARYGS